jgi:hypothetical protein
MIAYQLLQALHLLTDGGLGTTYRGSGRREGAQIGDGDAWIQHQQGRPALAPVSEEI